MMRALIPQSSGFGLARFLPGAKHTSSVERFQAKWKPVRIKKTRQIKNLEFRFDSIEAEKRL